MKSTLFIFRAVALSLLVAGATAQARITGAVTGIDEELIAVAGSDKGRLHVVERYVVRNSSAPMRPARNRLTLGIVLPPEAVVEDAEAQQPDKPPTTLKPAPNGSKGHYAFNLPIQPGDSGKGALFQIEYELPYSGQFTFHSQVTIPAKTVWVMLPKSMNFASSAGSAFLSAPQDPSFQTFVTKDAVPGKALEFTVSGNGSLAHEDQGEGGNQQTDGKPIDPLGKSKGWILGALGALLAASAAFLLRNPHRETVSEADTKTSVAQPERK
jgi:hypothetical protein